MKITHMIFKVADWLLIAYVYVSNALADWKRERLKRRNMKKDRLLYGSLLALALGLLLGLTGAALQISWLVVAAFASFGLALLLVLWALIRL